MKPTKILLFFVSAYLIVSCGPTNMTDADADFLIRQGGQMYSNAVGNNRQTFNSSITLYDNRGAIVGVLDNGYIYDSRSNMIGYVSGTSVYDVRSNYVGMLVGNVVQN